MKLYPIQHNLCTHVHILYMHIFTYILNTHNISRPQFLFGSQILVFRHW